MTLYKCAKCELIYEDNDPDESRCYDCCSYDVHETNTIREIDELVWKIKHLQEKLKTLEEKSYPKMT